MRAVQVGGDSQFACFSLSPPGAVWQTRQSSAAKKGAGFHSSLNPLIQHLLVVMSSVWGHSPDTGFCFIDFQALVDQQFFEINQLRLIAVLHEPSPTIRAFIPD